MVGVWLFFWAYAGCLGPGSVFPATRGQQVPDRAGQTGRGAPGRSRILIAASSISLHRCDGAAAWGLTLFLGGLVFLLLPRQAGGTRAGSSGTMSST